MSETVIYIKGDPGFKPAIITKLGRESIYNARDISEDVVSFSLPDGVSLVELKTSVGKDILSDFNVRFFDELPADMADTLKFVPGRPLKMSIWASNDSKLRAKAVILT